jgi:hypothetical protein
MTGRDWSDAELAEANYEERHGEIMYWAYGRQSAERGPDYSLARHETHDVRDREAALDGIERLSGEENSPEEWEDAWEAWAEKVDAERGRKLDRGDPEDRLDFELAGPDGMLYWIEEIVR